MRNGIRLKASFSHRVQHYMLPVVATILFIFYSSVSKTPHIYLFWHQLSWLSKVFLTFSKVHIQYPISTPWDKSNEYNKCFAYRTCSFLFIMLNVFEFCIFGFYRFVFLLFASDISRKHCACKICWGKQENSFISCTNCITCTTRWWAIYWHLI